MPGFHVENFGCRAARADGEAVSGSLRAAGLAECVAPAADVVVVNTCSVTAEADRAARAFIRRAHRLNPEARIVVTGCYAQRAPQELAAMAGVRAVVGNSHKALVPEIARKLIHKEPRNVSGEQDAPVHEFGRAAQPESSWIALDAAASASAGAVDGLVSVQSLLAASSSGGHAPIWADDRFAHSFLEEAQLAPGERTRPNLKIQEGCGNRCTFCVIPQTRGSSKSLPCEAVLRHVEGFVAAGGMELVLSGINLGRWGRDLSGKQRQTCANAGGPGAADSRSHRAAPAAPQLH